MGLTNSSSLQVPFREGVLLAKVRWVANYGPQLLVNLNQVEKAAEICQLQKHRQHPRIEKCQHSSETREPTSIDTFV